MTEVLGFSVVLVALLVVAAALWVSGAPEIEPREHLRIRHELYGGKLRVVENCKEAA